MKRAYAISNFLVIIGVIVWNYVGNALGINGNTVASVSDKYYNLFTPASYAFSIWGLIYFSLVAHVIFQFKRVFFDKKDDEFILRIGPWLIIANLANAMWLWLWLSEYTGWSILVIMIILASLLVIVFKLNMERWDAPLPVIVFVWWPFCLYSGWITVATIANFSAYLAKINWLAPFEEILWTILMIIVATLINLMMIAFRNMREFAAVGVWAFIAIAVRHWNELPALQWTALTCSVILFIAISIHGYKNRATNPFRKLSQAHS